MTETLDQLIKQFTYGLICCALGASLTAYYMTSGPVSEDIKRLYKNQVDMTSYIDAVCRGE